MAFWWPLLVIAFALAICKFLLMLIPSNVLSIDVDASDVIDYGTQPRENSFIYIPSRRQTDKVQCYEPATMKYLGYFPALKPGEVKERVAQARKAQKVWAKSSFKQRRQFLRILLKYIIEHQQLICKISSRDTGKTMVDASLGEIMTTCEKITWMLSEGSQWLRPEYRFGLNKLTIANCFPMVFWKVDAVLHKTSGVEFHPLGVIGAIVSWNYPFHNIFNTMLAAVFSGNGIVIKCRIELEKKTRLLVLDAADQLDRLGNKKARGTIAMAKVATPSMALKVLDMAMQVHGAAGLYGDTVLSHLWATARTLRIADGPDEVHLGTIAKLELRRAKL